MPFLVTVWAERLKDPNPENRFAILRELETIGEPESLVLLSSIYANDPNPQIRQMAQRVGKTIYYNIHRQHQTTQGASDEERRRAAEILAKANRNKRQKGS